MRFLQVTLLFTSLMLFLNGVNSAGYITPICYVDADCNHGQPTPCYCIGKVPPKSCVCTGLLFPDKKG